MTEKLAIIHRSFMEQWQQSNRPPLPKSQIDAALQRIDELVDNYPPENVIYVEELPSTGFPTLTERIDSGDSVVLVGTRAAYCLKRAREVLEGSGARVTLDPKGSLP